MSKKWVTFKHYANASGTQICIVRSSTLLNLFNAREHPEILCSVDKKIVLIFLPLNAICGLEYNFKVKANALKMWG